MRLHVCSRGQRRVQDDNSSMPPGPDNIGELCVRGPNVMKGYLHNATATNATIIDGWMHTGDLAWHDERGNVFVVDRLKELIKSKGFQVPPAELEGLMLQMPGVADCAAVGAPHERHGEVPVAFVVRRNPAGTEPTEEQVKEFIASRTADYKHLARVVFIDAIPKNASGKVLRRVLREKL
ncbi:hypothetical protein EON66_01650 [archaeon]|nr:MAG: hypothetical protein EON66_01650 [archaeon]